MSEVEDESVNLVVTSPPYFSLKSYSTWSHYSDYLDFMSKVSDECFRILKPGGWICCNVQDSIPFPPEADRERYSEPLAADCISIFRQSGFKYEKGIIWYKGQGTATQRLFGSFPQPGLILISSLTEHILLLRKLRGGKKTYHSDDIKKASLLSTEEWSKWALDHWEIRPERAKVVGHPAPFPIEIPSRVIRMFSFKGDTVLDPFMGSGTTAIAAKQLGRNYIGYEIHQEYVRLAQNRLLNEIDIFEEGLYQNRMSKVKIGDV
ncbi:MAG: site-specific DNA-methyltransferase [Candidatus Competibacteraceae bacterium]|nr:site-specific DNA-methyltransferase [Candidatus Competibacteraceae bacterium]